ncbi:MAG: hypothetical protein CM15mP93_11840 [Thiotrichaceae bacterium]|nr:MAG: hypothetical protein CM15mP93_11840 [Thiotrichaceae bacterium]
MNEIGLNSAKSYIARDFATAKKYQKKIGYPVIIRPSFTLGGSGGGIAYNDQEFSEIVNSGLEISLQQRFYSRSHYSDGKSMKWRL